MNSVMVGDDAAVVRPNGITTLDYEPELTFVLGQRAFHVASREAMSHIAGISAWRSDSSSVTAVNGSAKNSIASRKCGSASCAVAFSTRYTT